MKIKAAGLVLFCVCISSAVCAESTPALHIGRYVLSGTNIAMDINTVELTMYRGDTAVCNGTYRISGNTITITLCNATGAARIVNGRTVEFTIISDTSFTGSGKIWYRS